MVFVFDKHDDEIDNHQEQNSIESPAASRFGQRTVFAQQQPSEVKTVPVFVRLAHCCLFLRLRIIALTMKKIMHAMNMTMIIFDSRLLYL